MKNVGEHIHPIQGTGDSIAVSTDGEGAVQLTDHWRGVEYHTISGWGGPYIYPNSLEADNRPTNVALMFIIKAC